MSGQPRLADTPIGYPRPSPTLVLLTSAHESHPIVHRLVHGAGTCVPLNVIAFAPSRGSPVELQPGYAARKHRLFGLVSSLVEAFELGPDSDVVRAIAALRARLDR